MNSVVSETVATIAPAPATAATARQQATSTSVARNPPIAVLGRDVSVGETGIGKVGGRALPSVTRSKPELAFPLSKE
jgi:hypothetical protein